MKGKICLVTGANSGLGKVTALELARRGATVLLLCRDAERGAAACREIRERSANRAVELLVADLASLAETRRGAAEVERRHPRLHVLINNAGVSYPRRQLTADGHERTFAINHLAPFLLTCLLAPALRRAAPARVVTVSSDGHRAGRIDFDNLNGERRFNATLQYCNTKLANVLFTRELARRLHGSGVTANCLHPGAVRTGFAQDEPHWLGFLVKWTPFLLSPEQGARTSIYLATAPEVEGVSGEYFVRCKPRRPALRARDAETARRLWQKSAELTGADLPS